MPIFAKRFLIVAVVLAVLLTVVLLCVNVYLQSTGVQQRIRSSAEQALGAKITIRSTMYTPWDGFVLRGLAIPDPLLPESNIVEAEALRVRFAFWPLFQQRFVVTDLSLHSPKMIVRQLPEGDWMVPIPAPPAVSSAIPRAEAVTPRPPRTGFKSEVQRFRLLGGYMLFLDAKNRPVMVLEKADLDARISPDRTATGTYDIGNADVSGMLKPRKVGGTFLWSGTSLELPDIKGGLAKGQIAGAARFNFFPEPTFKLNMNLSETSFKRLAEEAGFDPETAQGILNGSFEMQGDPRTSKTLQGKGHLELLEGHMRPADFLIQLGSVLGVEELQMLKLSEAKLDFTIGDEKVRLGELFLKSENLILRAEGPIKFGGKMDLDAKLLINRKLQQQFKGVLGKGFTQSEDPEYQQIEFNVTGKPSSPKTDLLDKILGIKIGQDLGGLLNGLFRQIAPPKPEKKASGTPSGN